MAVFQLLTTDGQALGPIEVAHPDGKVGSVIYREGEPDMHVVGAIPSDNPEQYPILVVERMGGRWHRRQGNRMTAVRTLRVAEAVSVLTVVLAFAIVAVVRL